MDVSLSQFVQRSTASTYCCTSLANILGSKISFPGQTQYASTEQSYWSAQEGDLSPTCIIVPTTPSDVSKAVSIISKIPNCQFAIKGQSHAPAAGFANIDDGVTIDMTGLNSVSVNSDHSIASVGTGASWLDVYRYLDPLGLTVAGGRNGAVGVGGLTLGGGISYFAPRVGWTCDTVVNFEIVLASGKLVDVNAKSRPDLFRALKGGGNNFGVVTRIDFQTIAQGQILAGAVKQNFTYRDDVFKAFVDIAGAKEYDTYASLVLGLVFVSASKAWSISTTPIYTKPVLNPPVYQELLSIPSTVSSLALTNISTFAAEPATALRNWAFFTGTYGVSALLLSKMFESLNSTIYGFTIPNGIIWSIALEPLPTVITSFGDNNGGNSLGTSPGDGNGVVLLLAGIWNDTASNNIVEQTAKKMVNEINDIAQGMGLLHGFQYLNYADPSQDPIESYGKDNVRELRCASKKYDPEGIFQRQVPGGFKLH